MDVNHQIQEFKQQISILAKETAGAGQGRKYLKIDPKMGLMTAQKKEERATPQEINEYITNFLQENLNDMQLEDFTNAMMLLENIVSKNETETEDVRTKISDLFAVKVLPNSRGQETQNFKAASAVSNAVTEPQAESSSSAVTESQAESSASVDTAHSTDDETSSSEAATTSAQSIEESASSNTEQAEEEHSDLLSNAKEQLSSELSNYISQLGEYFQNDIETCRLISAGLGSQKEFDLFENNISSQIHTVLNDVNDEAQKSFEEPNADIPELLEHYSEKLQEEVQKLVPQLSQSISSLKKSLNQESLAANTHLSAEQQKTIESLFLKSISKRMNELDVAAAKISRREFGTLHSYTVVQDEGAKVLRHTHSQEKIQGKTQTVAEVSFIAKGGIKYIYSLANASGEVSHVRAVVFKPAMIEPSVIEATKLFRNEQHILAGHFMSYTDAKGETKMAFVSEFMNTDLKKLSEQGIPKTALLNSFMQTIAGLSIVHDKKVAHFDIKPDNIFVNYDPENPNEIDARIADFDLAHIFKQDEDEEEPIVMKGSPECMSPEMANANKGIKNFEDAVKADIYSLGVTFYKAYKGSELITTYKDFENGKQCIDYVANLTYELMDSELDFPESNDPNSLEHLIWEMVNPDPLGRPTLEQISKRLELMAIESSGF